MTRSSLGRVQSGEIWALISKVGGTVTVAWNFFVIDSRNRLVGNNQVLIVCQREPRAQ